MGELYQIYLITNTVNNKKYVGQVVKHRGYLVRYKEHLNAAKYANTKLLTNAIKKYGKNNFSVQLIADDVAENVIDEKERSYISYFNTFYENNAGYNMTVGGQGSHGYKFTSSDKEKISAASLEHWKKLRNDPKKFAERNSKISSKMTGKPKSEIAKKHQREAAKKRFETECGTFTGKAHTQKTKQLIAEKNGNPVGMYDKNTGKLIKTFISATEASRYLNENNLTTNKSAFSRIITVCKEVKGQGKIAYKHIWKYLR